MAESDVEWAKIACFDYYVGWVYSVFFEVGLLFADREGGGEVWGFEGQWGCTGVFLDLCRVYHSRRELQQNRNKQRDRITPAHAWILPDRRWRHPRNSPKDKPRLWIPRTFYSQIMHWKQHNLQKRQNPKQRKRDYFFRIPPSPFFKFEYWSAWWFDTHGVGVDIWIGAWEQLWLQYYAE